MRLLRQLTHCLQLVGLTACLLVEVTGSGWAQLTNSSNPQQGIAGSDLDNTVVASNSPVIGRAVNARKYRIGAGDVLDIDVWKEPDASASSAPVRPDGKVTLPMVGEVQAAGLTPVELEADLAARYKDYVRNARVTVGVKAFNSHKVYVVGGVRREGSVRMDAPLTVLQALAEAGGMTDFAKRKKIYVLRIEAGKPVLIPFNYDAVVRGAHMEQNTVLAPGDTIVVPD